MTTPSLASFVDTVHFVRTPPPQLPRTRQALRYLAAPRNWPRLVGTGACYGGLVVLTFVLGGLMVSAIVLVMGAIDIHRGFKSWQIVEWTKRQWKPFADRAEAQWCQQPLRVRSVQGQSNGTVLVEVIADHELRLLELPLTRVQWDGCPNAQTLIISHLGCDLLPQLVNSQQNEQLSMAVHLWPAEAKLT